jgi:hypothetical protein
MIWDRNPWIGRSTQSSNGDAKDLAYLSWMSLSRSSEPHPVQSFKVVLFEPLGAPVLVFPGFFVLLLVLSLSGTRTQPSGTRNRCGIFEYEYQFIEYEYEYDRSQNSATSKVQLCPQCLHKQSILLPCITIPLGLHSYFR